MVFFLSSIPKSSYLHFLARLICVWIRRCKGDPWGQAVQVFYFSHRCTHRRTEFGIIHIVWGPSYSFWFCGHIFFLQ